MKRFSAFFFLLSLLAGAFPASAVVYVNCDCALDGDGTTSSCASAAAGAGAKNAAVTTVAASTEYSYAKGSTCTLASTSITVNQNAVTLSTYGTGAKPIIVGNAASYALTVTTSNGFSVTGLDWRNGVTGAVNLSATTTGGTFSGNAINSSVIGLVISAAGATNITGSGNTTTCTGSASICWNITTNGGGIAFSDSPITLTATDRSSTSLIGVRLSGTATVLNNIDVTGGNMGVEIRTTNGHTVKLGEYSGQLVAGVRIRDSQNNRVLFNSFHDIDTGVAYPSGQGNAIDMIDPGAACAGNMILGNDFHAVYQGIVDQCDNGTGGGNFILSNIGWDYSVDGISYQAAVGFGYIAGNTLLHNPRSHVGHAIAIQHSSVITMTAEVANNTCVNLQVGDNIQCFSIPDSAHSGPIFVNNNNWYAGVTGAALAKLDTVSPACSALSSPAWCEYYTLATWQTALQADADTTGDESASLSVIPGWVGGPTPSTKEGFKLNSNSGLIRHGLCYFGTGCAANDAGNRRVFVPPDIGAYQRVVGDP